PAPERAGARASVRRPFLHFLAGLSLRNRDVVLAVADGRLLHSVPLYPEVLGELRVRPLAGGDEPLLAGLEVRARVGYALFFESTTPSGQVIGGAAWSLEGDLGWLAPLDDAGLVELGPRVGGGFTSYGLDDNAFVPTVEYGSFEARAATRIRAMDEQLVIRAEAGYRLALGGGALAQAYGSPTGHGVVLEAGLEGIAPFDDSIGLSWLVALEWSHGWLGLDGPASQELARSGEERFFRGRAGVGLAFR
ncbi:MAG: hypothetical protein KF729_38125, partial [Sandaracinaceae bacterium]|nr:hypothetical protein [Sandaracinaceae bacterium]